LPEIITSSSSTTASYGSSTSLGSTTGSSTSSCTAGPTDCTRLSAGRVSFAGSGGAPKSNAICVSGLRMLYKDSIQQFSIRCTSDDVEKMCSAEKSQADHSISLNTVSVFIVPKSCTCQLK